MEHPIGILETTTSPKNQKTIDELDTMSETNGEEMRSMSVSACGYVHEKQTFTRSGNVYDEIDASSSSS